MAKALISVLLFSSPSPAAPATTTLSPVQQRRGQATGAGRPGPAQPVVRGIPGQASGDSRGKTANRRQPVQRRPTQYRHLRPFRTARKPAMRASSFGAGRSAAGQALDHQRVVDIDVQPARVVVHGHGIVRAQRPGDFRSGGAAGLLDDGRGSLLADIGLHRIGIATAVRCRVAAGALALPVATLAPSVDGLSPLLLQPASRAARTSALENCFKGIPPPLIFWDRHLTSGMGFLAKLQSALTNSPASVAAQALQFATHHGRVFRRTQEVELARDPVQPAAACSARASSRRRASSSARCRCCRWNAWRFDRPEASPVRSSGVSVMALFATCCTSRTF